MSLYSPEPVPYETKYLSEFLTRELAKISIAINSNDIVVTYVEPEKPRDGDTYLADGTEWNPNGTGQGVYTFYNNTWNKLGQIMFNFSGLTGLLDNFKMPQFDGFGNDVSQGMAQINEAMPMQHMPQSDLTMPQLKQMSQGLDNLVGQTSYQPPIAVDPSQALAFNDIGARMASPLDNGSGVLQNPANSSTLNPSKSPFDWERLSRNLGSIKLPEQPEAPSLPTIKAIMGRGSRGGKAPAMPNLGALSQFNRASMPTTGAMPPWVQQMMATRR